MEETREMALAYYANSSDGIKSLAKNLFDRMDTDGDGKITVKEFEEYVKERSPRIKSVLFAELDKDGDGFLDFEEVIVFSYIVNFRYFWCDVCKTLLKTGYFTCRECFLKENYDLCLTCYATKQFNHEHKDFVDNYAMLAFIQNESKKKETRRKKQETGKKNQDASCSINLSLDLGGLCQIS